MNKYKLSILLLICSSSVFAGGTILPAGLSFETIFSASSPTAVRHAGDGSNRLFITEQAGTIRIYDGQNLLPTDFLDISSKVSCCSERGLLGIDFDPNFAENGYFYVNYTKSSPNNGDTVIERYKVSDDDPNIADPNSGQILLRIDQPFSNHNGGDIHFGPDDYLYIGMGDGGSGGDPDNYSQRNNELLGKMLRIDVNPDIIYKNSTELDNSCGLDQGQYYVPSDNPFTQNANFCGEIWSYGLRNPYRFSFDSLEGDLIIGDVGQNAVEEVDFQLASSLGGENYGWRCREGAQDFETDKCDNGDVYVEPVINLPQNQNGGCSVMGGYVYRGPIQEIQGLYIFSDYCGGEMNFATINLTPGASWSYTNLNDDGFGTRGFGEDEQGNVYQIFNNSVRLLGINPQ
ncbi:MAG: sorbosone dehydrogenase family protein [Marinicellaceae bacterium]